MKTIILPLIVMLLTTAGAGAAPRQKTGFIPLQLVGFTAHARGQEVKLTWETNMEQNNQGFIVEYSVDGASWQQIGFVDGAGNSFSVRSYEFLHLNPSGALNYYRLEEVDLNNNKIYSDVRQVAIDRKQVSILLYPNPVSNTLFVQLNSPEDRFLVRVMDMMGKPVRSFAQAAGADLISLDISGLNRGLYFVEIDNLTAKTCAGKSKIQKL